MTSSHFLIDGHCARHPATKRFVAIASQKNSGIVTITCGARMSRLTGGDHVILFSRSTLTRAATRHCIGMIKIGTIGTLIEHVTIVACKILSDAC